MYLHQSNRLQELFHQLCAIIGRQPADPLQPEIIVVHNQGMARWLRQQIALATGIAANLEFPLPARFIWELFAGQLGDLPDESLFDRDVMLWRIHELLPALAEEVGAAEPARYLADDGDGSRRYQLAAKISDLFDQYLVFRPDLLAAWEQGREEHWQAVLWRRLADCGQAHRGGLLYRFLEICRQGSLKTDSLPERVCLFGISSLAPAYLEVLHQVSRHCQVHLFHLNPCRHFWGDLVSEHELAGLRRKWRLQESADLSDTFDTGHPLLASLGATGRDFFRQLVELDLEDMELYVPSGRDTLLGRLQDDILDLEDRTGDDKPAHALAPDDRSIQFHVCHGLLREVQVLHDRLLDLFARLPGLLPGDILVMAPDIEQYAPAVRGVFGSAADEHRVPWSIADQSRRRERPLDAGFLELLTLLDSRFTASEVMAFLENPAVLRRFGLEEDDLTTLRGRIAEAGIRWGIDRDHRQQLGVAADDLHSWSFGLDRLLLGYVMGGDAGLYDGILPCPPLDAGILGGLAELLARLAWWRRQLGLEMPPAEWAGLLPTLLDDFFAGDDDEALPALRETLTELAAAWRLAACRDPLSLQVIRTHFRQILARPDGGLAFLGGQVTFCNMVPMRSIPFRVICLLGMNDTDFPRNQRPPAFDLMARHPRIGDRNRRNDDRYLFLEALLSARDVLYISWKGRDPRDNALLPPSVVVSELRDHIDRAWTCGDSTRPCDRLTVEHPLQPFSRRCFDPAAPTASYAAAWLPAVRRRQWEEPFLVSPLPDNDDHGRTDLDELIRFWCHPVRAFLRQRLGLRLDRPERELADSEPFTLDGLEEYLLTGECIAALLDDRHRPCGYRELAAAGRLPHQAFGANRYRAISDLARAMADRIAALRGRPLEPVEISLAAGGHRLEGWLGNLSSRGIVTWRPATCKATDLLRLWLCHLALHLATPGEIPRTSAHVAKDSVIRLRPVAEPEAELARLLILRRQGLQRPLHFYPRTSMAWAEAGEGRRMSKARRQWQGGYYHPGEGEDIHYHLALRGEEPLDGQFEELAGIFTSILTHREEMDADS